MSSSQSARSESEMGPELRAVMSDDLFRAAIEGDSDVITQTIACLLRLDPQEQTEIDQVAIQMENQIREDQTVQSELQSATHFGDTVLHLLVTNRHNELALNVFQRDMSLLKAQNGMLETPLHCAAKVGNNDIIDSLIESSCSIVKDALKKKNKNGDTVLHLLVTKKHNELAFKVFQSDECLLKAQNGMLETPLHCAAKVGNNEIIDWLSQSYPLTVKHALRKKNKNGDTALHVAAKHGHKEVGCKLMELDPEVAYKVNNEMLSPLNIAIVKENIEMVRNMLVVNPTLAYTQFKDGMFPVHVAARMGIKNMVMHFIENYPDDAKLLDPHGRNLLHIVAEEDRKDLFQDLFKETSVGGMLATMNNEPDYEGNSLLHIAAMKGHTSMMQAIWKKDPRQGEKTNNQGLTPLDLFMRQLRATSKVDYRRVDDYLATVGLNRFTDKPKKKFTNKWFDYVLKLLGPNKWDKTQVIGLGSVLITTVAFAAGFTIPGGYKQDDGTPVLVRKYMFRAFIVANTLAFILAFSCLFKVFKRAMEDQPGQALDFAIDTFMLAASSMVLAFGLGLYLTLAPDCKPIAIFVLVSTLFVSIVNMSVRSNNWSIGLPSYVVTYLLIFGLAFLS